MSNKQQKPLVRKKWFYGVRKFLRLIIKTSTFTYLGGPVEKGSVILSNHAGSGGPLAYDLYSGWDFRFWGTYEMNSGIRKCYKYLSEVFFHQKKGWNLHLARVVCIIAAPLLNLYYKGLNLISTYPDVRFKNSLTESMRTIKEGTNIIIFPEDSSKGYFDELTIFHRGCLSFIRLCLKKGMDIPVHVAYYQKHKKKCIIDKASPASEIFKLAETDEEIARILCNRCNELGKMEV